MKKYTFWFSALAAASCILSTNASADLIVNGTDNGSWSDNATMSYNSNPTDPLSISSNQFNLGGGGSLAVSSGSLTLTNTNYGAFIGQGGNGSLTVSGGLLTWNANGGSEQRAVIGNGGYTGTVTITGGEFNFNTGVGTDTSRGLVFGRQGGSANLTLSGTGLFTSASDYFGLGGEYTGSNTWQNDGGGANTITLGLGAPVFELTGLNGTSSSFFNINSTSSAFNFLTGSGGEVSINGASQTFYNSLIASGDFQVNSIADTNTSDYAFSTVGGQGILTLATTTSVPEPSTYVMLVGGMLLLVGFQRFRRRSSV